jgi:hypothetical protein
VIKDQTIDEALIEIMRTKKALEALRHLCRTVREQGHQPENCRHFAKAHAAAKRASLDLTRKLADLRAGR